MARLGGRGRSQAAEAKGAAIRGDGEGSKCSGISLDELRPRDRVGWGEGLCIFFFVF